MDTRVRTGGVPETDHAPVASSAYSAYMSVVLEVIARNCTDEFIVQTFS